MVYVAQQREWYPPSLCLWAKDSQISGKVSIATQYDGLEDFFLNGLKVEEPDVGMYVEELKLLVASDEIPPTDAVKELIKQINSMGPRLGALERLEMLPMLPVKSVDGQIFLARKTDAFAIVDHETYQELFSSKVPFLDYTKEEVHELQPFISALGLQERYISQLVQETSTVNVSSKSARLSNEIKQKAYALFR